MKYKKIEYKLINSSLIFRLNDKRLYLNYIGLSLNKSKLENALNLFIDNLGNVKNNYEILIKKEDQDTYIINYPDGTNTKLDILYYYLNELNKREYVDKSDIEIKPDGSLYYEGHKVKAYYKNEDGLILSGDFSDFIGSDKYEFENEEILNLEKEIKSLEYQNIEFKKVFDENYINYVYYQNTYEDLSYDLISLEADYGEAIKNANTSLKTLKNQYYNKTKKTLNNAWGPRSANSAEPNVEQYLYYDSDGFNMENYALKGFYTNGDPGSSDTDGIRAIGAITNAANRKAAGLISAKGLQATINLYGKTAFTVVQSAIPGTMRKLFFTSALKIAIYTPVANVFQSVLNYGYKTWGLI